MYENDSVDVIFCHIYCMFDVLIQFLLIDWWFPILLQVLDGTVGTCVGYLKGGHSKIQKCDTKPAISLPNIKLFPIKISSLLCQTAVLKKSALVGQWYHHYLQNSISLCDCSCWCTSSCRSCYSGLSNTSNAASGPFAVSTMPGYTGIFQYMVSPLQVVSKDNTLLIILLLARRRRRTIPGVASTGDAGSRSSCSIVKTNNPEQDQLFLLLEVAPSIARRLAAETMGEILEIILFVWLKSDKQNASRFDS